MIDKAATLVRVSTTRTARGDTTETVEEIPLRGLFAPAQSAETFAPGSPAVTVPAQFILPRYAPTVTAADRIVVDGETYAVDGEPSTWDGAGTVVTLTRWEGA